MKKLKEDTIALMVDLQEKLVPAMYNNKELVDNNIRLIKGLKVLDVPIIISQQYTKGLGMTIEEIKNEIGEKFTYYDKINFSCVKDEAIYETVKKFNKKNIILFGIEAHICVQQTAIDLLMKNFNVIIVEDCISSRTANNKKVAINRILNEGAIIATYESILYELLEKASTEEFKKVSKIIK